MLIKFYLIGSRVDRVAAFMGESTTFPDLSMTPDDAFQIVKI
jgi:hypothetical protein